MPARSPTLLRSAALGLVLALAAGCAEDRRGGTASASLAAGAQPAPTAPAGSPGTSPPAAVAPVSSAGAPAPSAVRPFVPLPVLVPSGPLLQIGPNYLANGGDPVHPPELLESDRFTNRNPQQVPGLLKLVTWNVEWGKHVDRVLQQLVSDPFLADADFLLLTEVPRHDPESNPPGINLARELAQRLQMDYVFAVEWDRRLEVPNGGEHGTAILSKYPLGNATHIRHTPAYDHYGNLGRIGGRHSLGVDALVGGKRLRLYTVHLATRDAGPGRAAQAAEVRADADLPDQPGAQVMAGDYNTWTCNPIQWDCSVAPAAEPAIRDMFREGWLDGTAGFTAFTQLGLGFFPQRLDWIFYRGLQAVPGRAVGTRASDHLPLYCELTPP